MMTIERTPLLKLQDGCYSWNLTGNRVIDDWICCRDAVKLFPALSKGGQLVQKVQGVISDEPPSDPTQVHYLFELDGDNLYRADSELEYPENIVPIHYELARWLRDNAPAVSLLMGYVYRFYGWIEEAE